MNFVPNLRQNEISFYIVLKVSLLRYWCFFPSSHNNLKPIKLQEWALVFFDVTGVYWREKGGVRIGKNLLCIYCCQLIGRANCCFLILKKNSCFPFQGGCPKQTLVCALVRTQPKPQKYILLRWYWLIVGMLIWKKSCLFAEVRS